MVFIHSVSSALMGRGDLIMGSGPHTGGVPAGMGAPQGDWPEVEEFARGSHEDS